MKSSFITRLIPITKVVSAIAIIAGPTFYGTKWYVETQSIITKQPLIERAINDLSKKVDNVNLTVDSTLIETRENKTELGKFSKAFEKHVSKSPDKQDMIDFLNTMRAQNIEKKSLCYS